MSEGKSNTVYSISMDEKSLFEHIFVGRYINLDIGCLLLANGDLNFYFHPILLCLPNLGWCIAKI